MYSENKKEDILSLSWKCPKFEKSRFGGRYLDFGADHDKPPAALLQAADGRVPGALLRTRGGYQFLRTIVILWDSIPNAKRVKYVMRVLTSVDFVGDSGIGMYASFAFDSTEPVGDVNRAGKCRSGARRASGRAASKPAARRPA